MMVQILSNLVAMIYIVARIRWLWLKKSYIGCALQKDRYTLIEQSPKSRITCMQYSQKNFMRIIGNDQRNNGQDFWEIPERILGKISSIIGAGRPKMDQCRPQGIMRE